MKKRIVSFILAALLICTLLPVSAFADTVKSGTCGNDLTWALDDAGTLTISGTGNMWNYSMQKVNNKYITTAPWGEYYDTIKSVVIEAGVTSIVDYAFYGCSSLASVTIPNSVTSIGYDAFYGCSSLASVTIPDSVTTIGDWAFYNCSSLTSVTIPDSVTSIESSTFHGCSSLASVTIPNSVTSIGYGAFSSCSSLASVTIPDSVTAIGDYAFSSCSSLASVTIPDSVTTIGDWAFSSCSSLASVTIPNSVTSIGEGAFNGCSKLKVVNYDGNIESWLGIEFASSSSNPCDNGSNLYFNGELVTNAVIPDSITSIGRSAFSGCSSLTSVTIPDSVTSIGGGAFANCSSLASVTIPNSVTSIGYDAFYGCSSLASVTIPNSVMSIGSSAFEGCSSLESVTIPDSVTGIGERAFYGCSRLASVTIGNSVTSVGDYAFYNCSRLASVTIGNSVTSIGDWAFDGCSSLASVTIPDSVTSIGDYAFCYCSSLASVTIPDSVTSIGRDAFYGCSKLKDAAFGGTKEEWEATGYTFPSYVRMHYSCKSLDGHYVPVEVKEPNCQSTGYIKYNCSCGYEYTETLPKSHDYVFSKTVAPTCSEHGYDLLKCSKCGAEKKEYHDDELLQHSYVVSAVEPSCLVGGYKLHECSVCGYSYKDELVQPLGHSETNAEAKAPTCTEAGHTAGTCCSRCGKIMSGMAEIAALGHDFGAWKQTTAPTCAEKGVETRYCSRCDATETREVDALGHALVHHDGKAATCTEAGWEAYDTCSRCDYTTYKEISALGHDYKDGVCTVCGAKEPAPQENPFVDVAEDAVYYDAVLWAYYHEPQQITGGYTATEFRPGNPCTRGQVVTFLWRAAGCPEPTGDTSMFKDASSIAEPYQKAVAWAVEKGITTGYEDSTFRPNDSVTRAQFVTFLWRYEGKPATSGSIAGFTDASSISGPYQQAVAWAVEKGITTGYNDGSFRPNAICPRWAVVLFMYRDMK